MNYSLLFNELNNFINKTISYSDLKHITANYGIYQQRDGLFMVRIRVTGGEVSLKKLKAIYEVAETHNVKFIHLTSRQDFQLHGISAENIIPIINKCTENGMPFRGGGGDTFRNIAVSYNSGLSEESVFNVLPYAKLLTEKMFNNDKAFENLPRKLKIVISCNDKDNALAKIQDLGFIAKIKDGHHGFEVYGGGGMGNQSSPGIKLIDFIAAADIYKCAAAMTDLFYDHGDRTSRSKARIRFILKKLGEQNFIKLFLDYFDNIKADKLNLKDIEISTKDIISERFTSKPSNLISHSETKPAFNSWLQYAVEETKFKEISLIRLFIPYGNLTPAEFYSLIKFLSSTGAKFIRLSREETIYVPVKNESLKSVFIKLSKLNYTGASFKGQITTCIGTKTCPIGIINTHEFADSIAVELDSYFKENSTGKEEFIKYILDEIKISGCPNSCSNHHAFLLGFQGIRKKNLFGELCDYCKITIGGSSNSIASTVNDLLLDSKQIGKYVRSIVKDFNAQKTISDKLNFKKFLTISGNDFLK